MLTDDQQELQFRVAHALGIRGNFPPMLLVSGDGKVRRLLTGLGDVVEGWPDKARAS